MPKQLYTIHQLRLLSNTVLHALSTRPLADTRPDQADRRFRVTASSPGAPGITSTLIPETRRMLAINPGHDGLGLPITGILITQAQLDQWQDKASHTRQASLHRAVKKTSQAKRNGLTVPAPWHPLLHPTEGWICITNPAFTNQTRSACLELLNIAIEAGNVRPVGRDEKSIGAGPSSTARAA